jgi:hypothetical protein
MFEEAAMHRPILLAIACAILLSAPRSALSDEMRIYQWTDSQGVVHYSQFEPDNTKTQARNLHNSDPVVPKTPTQMACDTAKANRDLLEKGKPGHMYADKDGDGKPDLLSDDDVKKAKDLVDSQIKANCGN